MTNNGIENLFLEITNAGYVIYPANEKLSLLKIKSDALDSGLLDNLKSNKAAILNYLINAPHVVSYQQQSLWFINKLQGGQSPEYNMSLVFQCPHELNLPHLIRALTIVIGEHPPLYSKYVNENNSIVHKPISFIENLAHISAVLVQSESELRHKLTIEANRVFELDKDLPFSIKVYCKQFDDQKVCVQLTIHHIAFDGWSSNIFRQKLAYYYNQPQDIQKIRNEKLAVSFFDYCRWQHSWCKTDWFQNDLNFWRKELKELPSLIPFQPLKTGRAYNNQGGVITLNFGKSLSADIMQCCDQGHFTLFTFLMSGLAILLSSLYKRDDLIIGTPYANRRISAFEELIGYFANTIPMRCKIVAHFTLQEVIESIKKTCYEVNEYQWVPFSMIAHSLEANGSAMDLFNVFLACHRQDDAKMRVQFEPFETMTYHQTNHARFDLSIDCIATSSGEISSIFQYKTSVLSDLYMQHFSTGFREILIALLQFPGEKVTELSLRVYRSEWYLALKTNSKLQSIENCSSALEPTLSVYEGAQTTLGTRDIEAELRLIWKAVLGIDVNSTTQSFFSVGGNSISLLQLMQRVNETFNTNYPIAWGVENLTIDKQRRKLTQHNPPDYKPIVNFGESSKDHPLVFVPPSMVGAEVYQNLFSLFRVKQNFYCLNNYNLNGGHAKIYSYQQLATLYNDFVQNEFTKSFFLGGYCYGGVIALEMAKQLAEQGKVVSMLYLFDPLLMYGDEKPADKPPDSLLKMAGYVRLPDGKILPEASNQYIDRLVSSGIQDRNMIHEYSKNVPIYDHPVLLFLSRKREGKLISYEDELEFWKMHLPQAKIISIDANHSELLSNEYLSSVVEYIEFDISRRKQEATSLSDKNLNVTKELSPASLSEEEIIKLGLQIRAFEEMLLELYSQGKLYGTVHTCVGQELCAISVIQQLQSTDTVFSNHRGHGHFLAFTGDSRGLLAEIMGKSSGICQGIGGSQHLYAPGFYSNGIQGGMLPVAAGVAFCCNSSSIAVSFIGDGTFGEGIVYETLNIVSKWSLPLLIVVENNQYAQSTSIRQNLAGSIRGRAQAFDIMYYACDSNELTFLLEQTKRAVDYVRQFRAPAIIEISTSRLNPHSKGDDSRDPAEINYYKSKDLINRYVQAQPEKYQEHFTAVKRELLRIAEDLYRQPTVSHCFDNKNSNLSVTWSLLPPLTTSAKLVDLIYSRFKLLLEDNVDAMIVGEDIEWPYGGAFKVTQDLSKIFPARVKNTPISESAIVGLATGMVLAGRITLVEIMFGDFLTLTFDQLYQHACKFHDLYAKAVKIPLIIRTPMGGRRGYGPTHSQSLEKFFIGIPGLQILALNVRVSPYLIYDQLFNSITSPTLVIENKLLYGQQLRSKSLQGFQIMLSDELFPTIRIQPNEYKPEFTVLCYGGMLGIAEEALHKIFEEYEICCEIICPAKIYPMNLMPVIDSVKHTHRLITLEEGPCIAGWGSELLSGLLENGITVEFFRRIGYNHIIPSSFECEKKVLPSVDSILSIIEEFMQCV